MREPQPPRPASRRLRRLGLASCHLLAGCCSRSRQRSGARHRRASRKPRGDAQEPAPARRGGRRRRAAADLAARPRPRRPLRTCHLGIDDPAFANAPAPFRTHPATWLTTHPVDRFGCSVVPRRPGSRRPTTRNAVASSRVRSCRRAMRPLETIEANCGACHRSLEPADAPRLAEGRRLIIESGCVSLPRDPRLRGVDVQRAGARRASATRCGPSGWSAGSRTRRAISRTRRWATSACAERDRGTPRASCCRSALRCRSTAVEVDWTKADTANGRALFGELRCVSCHAVNGRGGTMGPELTRIGDKVRRDWLFSYLKDPHRVQPDTADAAVPPDRRSVARSHRLPARGIQDSAERRSRAARRRPIRMRGRSRPDAPCSSGAAATSCHRARRHPRVGGRVGPSLAGVADRDPDELPYGSKIVRHTAENYIFLKLLMPDALGAALAMPTSRSPRPRRPGSRWRSPACARRTCPASYVLKQPPPTPYRAGRARFGELM